MATRKIQLKGVWKIFLMVVEPHGVSLENPITLAIRVRVQELSLPGCCCFYHLSLFAEISIHYLKYQQPPFCRPLLSPPRWQRRRRLVRPFTRFAKINCFVGVDYKRNKGARIPLEGVQIKRVSKRFSLAPTLSLFLLNRYRCFPEPLAFFG